MSFYAWRNGWYVQITCFQGTSIGVEKSAKIGSNARKTVLIFIENILSNNRAISDYKHLFLFVYLKT